MLLWLFEYLAQFHSGFNVFGYLTFRGILGILTALIFSFIAGPVMIRKLQLYQIGQSVRDDGPQSHLAKAGTPTMGGALILLAVAMSTLLWADLSNIYIWMVLGVTGIFGMVGWVDDYRKVIRKDSKGLPARWKFFWQSIAGFSVAVLLYNEAGIDRSILVPFFKDITIPLGILYVPWVLLVLVGSSNAVNLTDGLDGLAIVPIAMVAGALGIFAYVTGHAGLSQYLMLPTVSGTGELVVICASLVGAGLGFLWFNAYPAQVFMGDVGSLSLGAALGIIAVIVRQELVLFIMGGVFVLETVSVILQVGSYKLRGKRIFKMAPIHHHFELRGWEEPKVIVRFWIMTVILVLFGLASLKLR